MSRALLFAIVLCDYGGLGVNLFLVISGFCIHLPTVRAGIGTDVSFFAFWKRRMMRLYPPYFVALVLTLAGRALANRGHGDGSFVGMFGYASGWRFALDVGSLLLLMQNFTSASRHVGNGPLWTLALEEQLYALYFPLLRLRRALPWKRVLVIVLACTFSCRLIALGLHHAHALGDVQWYALGPPRWMEWVIGALAVEAQLRGEPLPRWCRSPALGIAAFLVAFALRFPYELAARLPDLKPRIPFFDAARVADILFSDPMFSFSGFVAVNWAIARRVGEPGAAVWVRFLGWVGFLSYSLYLVHEPVFGMIRVVGQRFGLPVPLLYLLRIGGALGAAWIFHVVIERRFLLRARAWAWEGKRKGDSAAAPPSERAA